VAEEDYRFYRECLRDAAERHGCSIHAYVFMTNHVHLLVTPDSAQSLPKLLQSVGRRRRHWKQDGRGKLQGLKSAAR
jgi:putative transposase